MTILCHFLVKNREIYLISNVIIFEVPVKMLVKRYRQLGASRDDLNRHSCDYWITKMKCM